MSLEDALGKQHSAVEKQECGDRGTPDSFSASDKLHDLGQALPLSKCHFPHL